MNKLSVKETIAKLKEKNPAPRRIYNKSELTQVVQALLTDSDYIARHTKVKSGAFITEDRHLSGEFKKALIDIVKQLGLSAKEAEAAIESYRVSKVMATAMIDAVSHASFLYMKEIGKGINFIGESDAQQTIFFRSVDEKQHRIPKTRDGKDPAHSKVKVKPHNRIAIKTKVNPSFKELLK